ncbi:MAG: hypothetical protein Q9165_002888 [Trypethelium subeluteriae]
MSLSYLLARALPAHELSNEQQGEGCLPYDPLLRPGYGYIPSLAVGIVFAVIFGLITIAHIGQTTIKRKWWYSTFAIGAIGIYYILSQLLQHWRQQGYTHYSPLSPRLYLIIFISFDLLSIIIQGVGGGIAASANNDDKDTAPGTHIMIAGIIIQLVSMSVFCFLWLWTVYRARAHLHTPATAGDKLSGSRLRLLVATTCFAATCIVVRNFYRAVELGQGWTGYLITHEIYFCLLDGMLMALSLLAFNIVHPAWFVDPGRQAPARDLEAKRPSDSSLDPAVMMSEARA